MLYLSYIATLSPSSGVTNGLNRLTGKDGMQAALPKLSYDRAS